MRTIYSRESKKVEMSKRSGAGTDSAYVPKWAHFTRLDFIKDVLKPAPSQDNIEQTPSPTSQVANVHYEVNRKSKLDSWSMNVIMNIFFVF